jgi:hypothetical protein
MPAIASSGREATSRFRRCRFGVPGVDGVDGTTVAPPRSDSNVRHFGISNKPHAVPEMVLCDLDRVAICSLRPFAREVACGS